MVQVKRKQAYLWPSAANLTHITVVYLWWFWWLLGFEGFVLKGCFLGECASSPGSSGCCNSNGLLLLLLLLLLVVRGCCRVHSCLITRIWCAWKQIQEINNQRCCNEDGHIMADLNNAFFFFYLLGHYICNKLVQSNVLNKADKLEFTSQLTPVIRV